MKDEKNKHEWEDTKGRTFDGRPSSYEFLTSSPKTTENPPCQTLRRVRLEKNLKQADLAVLLIQGGSRIGSHYISRFESGHQRPWPAARRALCAVLGMDESELFPELD